MTYNHIEFPLFSIFHSGGLGGGMGGGFSPFGMMGGHGRREQRKRRGQDMVHPLRFVWNTLDVLKYEARNMIPSIANAICYVFIWCAS